ncbi:MAG: hypothetical protein FWD96_01675 [Defluviitaleaceae bacterium]|nr:hypothetical protein [Defluviitaleaceae bacterium]
MQYYNTNQAEQQKFEAMLLEFLEFRKTQKPEANKAFATSITPDIGKGWPHYKGYAAALQKASLDNPGCMGEQPALSQTNSHICACKNKAAAPPQTNETTATILSYTPIASAVPTQPESQAAQSPPVTEQTPIGYSSPDRHAHKEYDLDYAHHLMGEIASALMPHVIDVINENEFSGSSIFEGYLYRERLHQMIELALRRAAAANPAIAEITETSCGCRQWSHMQLLRAVVETLIIGELFFRRRPIYRKLIDNGWNPHEVV